MATFGGTQSSQESGHAEERTFSAAAYGPHAQAAQYITNNINFGPDNVHLDDVYQSVQAMLKAKHWKIKIPKMPWIEHNWEFPLEHYYVDLTVSPKDDIARGLLAKCVQLVDIFKPVGCKRSTRILVEGPAGYGKSMLSLKLCYDYAKGEDYMNEYELVILLCLREFKASSVDEMLAKKLNLQDHSAPRILEAIKKNQKSTLIILDGYDESDQETRHFLVPLLKSEYLPESTVVVTSRPGAASSTDDFIKRIEIKGLTGNKRGQFLELHLQSCSEEKKVFIKQFMFTNFDIVMDGEPLLKRLFRRLQKSLFCSQEKECLFDCPLFLLLVVTVVKNSYPNITTFSTKTELYKKLFNFVAQRTLGERFRSHVVVDLFVFDVEKPPLYAQSLAKFGELALAALAEKRITFTTEEILSQTNGDDIILQMGLLTENDSVDDIGGQHTSWVQPIHLSILEFCAAYFLWYSFRCNPSVFPVPAQFLPELSGNVEIFVFPFLIGLCGNDLPSLFEAAAVGELPADMVRRFARCKSLTTESILESGALIKSLFPLVPKTWHTSYFTDGRYTASNLLKEVVAEAGFFQKLECIVHDSDLTWDLSMGKWIPLPVLIIMASSSSQALKHAYRKVKFYELRMVMKSIKSIVNLIPLAALKSPSVLSFVENDASIKLEDLQSLFPSNRYAELCVLSSVTELELEVVQTRNTSENVGKTVGVFSPLLNWHALGRKNTSVLSWLQRD